MTPERKRMHELVGEPHDHDIWQELHDFVTDDRPRLLMGPNGPEWAIPVQPSEEDLVCDQEEMELDIAKAVWRPDDYDN